MGRYCPKEGKNRRKVTFSIRRCRFLLFILGNNVGISFFFPFHIVSCLRLRPPYVLAPCICAVPTCGHVYVVLSEKVCKFFCFPTLGTIIIRLGGLLSQNESPKSYSKGLRETFLCRLEVYRTAIN